MTISALIRAGALLLMVALAGCAAVQPESDGQPDALVTACRTGPDGGPPAAAMADRGIGGTGAPVADRGIGGTGIIGVVTGFASVCVNGLEVRYAGSVHVDIDGARSSAARLRAGQVVAILADGPASAPRARSITVRTEVAGRIEAVQPASGLLTIGGQTVVAPPGTWGAERFVLGEWVSVSGLRRPDGVVVAMRLDSAPAGMLRVRGPVSRAGGVTRVGGLALPEELAVGPRPDQPVTVSGTYVSGRPVVRSVVPDPLPADPGGYFGPAASHLVIEAYVRAEPGYVLVFGQKVPVAPGVPAMPGREGIAIVSLDRGADGSYIAGGVRYADPGRAIAAARATAAQPGTAPHGRRPGAVASPADSAVPSADPPTGAPVPATAAPDPVSVPAASSDPPGAAAATEATAPPGGAPPQGASGGVPVSSLAPPAAAGSARASVTTAVQSAAPDTRSPAAPPPPAAAVAPWQPAMTARPMRR